jgi:hypothetical protein
MPEDTGKITEIAQAVATVTEKVPVYQDAIQPAAQELGKGLQLVVRAVNAALTPLKGFIWGIEQIRDFVRTKVAEKLRSVPPEDIREPEPHIAVPAIEALRYTGAKEELAEMYANLLATSMDVKTALHAHPAFVDMIKNLSPDEARMLRYLSSNTLYPIINIKLVQSDNGAYVIAHRHFSLLGMDAHCQHPFLAASYLDNLVRLGLAEIPEFGHLTEEALYKRIEGFPQIKGILESYSKFTDRRCEVEKLRAMVTDLGQQFIRACVIDKNLQPRA